MFGARGTGKTSLLENSFAKEKVHKIDLLEADIFERFLLNPGLLVAELRGLSKDITWVIIDEIQKLPQLLDGVHLIIEESKRNNRPLYFALTGSSARKLKRPGVNLLAGRAHVFNLFPLTSNELGKNFKLAEVLSWGTLPEIWSNESDEVSRARFLRSYVQTYLKEEIWEEHIIRKLQPFRKFLEVAAQCNGQPVNYSAIARDVGADVTTVQNYYQILEDTLIVLSLEPFHESVRKRQLQRYKYYFFDLGITRALTSSLTIPLMPQIYAYGKAFEHFLTLEIYRLQLCKDLDYSLSYLLTKDGVEIDLVIERPGKKRALIEIKSSSLITEHDLKPLQGILADIPNSEAYCFSNDPIPKKFNNITALHWQDGLVNLGL